MNRPAALPMSKHGALSAAESRGLNFALIGLIALVVVFGFLTLPSGAPLRNPDTGELIGNSPFMNGLIAFIMLAFLVTGWAYGIGAGTVRTLTDVIKAIEKAVTGLGGTIFLFFVLSQFVAYFTYTNMGTVMALSLSEVLRSANIGALPLLLGFIVVVAVIDLLLTGAIAKWAIFAPVFVPLLMKLGVEPEAVLAAYRVGDSPMNAITPLNAYFALVVGFAQKYDKSAGIGTIVSMMLPYVVCDLRPVDRTVRGLEGARACLGASEKFEMRCGPISLMQRKDRTMATSAIPLDVKSAEERLMRFLSVEGVTGQEAKIAAAVSDELKKVGVPASCHPVRRRHKSASPCRPRREISSSSSRARDRVRDCCSRHISTRFHSARARSRSERAIGFSPTVRPRSAATTARAAPSW